MNIESAKNRIKIIEGLSARILRYCESYDPDSYDPANGVVHDVQTIQKQCRLLALDIEECGCKVGAVRDRHKENHEYGTD